MLVLLACGAATARAGFAVSASPDFPDQAMVGTTINTDVTIANGNFGSGDDTVSDRVVDVTLVPNCGEPPLTADCATPDAGVLVPSPGAKGLGAVGTACARNPSPGRCG